MIYLTAAYALIWLVVFGYVVVLYRRQQQLATTLANLEKKLLN